MTKLADRINGNRYVLINVFNSGYIIALLLFLAGSIGSFCDGIIASKGLGIAELAAIGIIYPYTKMMECISLLFSSGSQVIIGRKMYIPLKQHDRSGGTACHSASNCT